MPYRWSILNWEKLEKPRNRGHLTYSPIVPASTQHCTVPRYSATSSRASRARICSDPSERRSSLPGRAKSGAAGTSSPVIVRVPYLSCELEDGNIGVMASRKPRAEFARTLVRRVAKRSAYRCSFPDCDRTTTGPGAHDDQIATTGKAAHIYSARDGGPRGSGGLSFEQRRSIGNAIWLCAEHAERIDKNNGSEFPASTLKAYKRMHEEKIRCEAGGIGLKAGWIHSLRIDRAPVFRTPAEIQFGKVTVLHGGNDSGKTAICDWLQGMSDPSTLFRWADAKKPGSLSFEVAYLDPFNQKLRIRVQSPEEIEYFVNGEPIPFDPNPFRFVRLTDLQLSCFSDRLPAMTDLEFLSRTLSVNSALVRNMMPLVGVQRSSTVGGTRVEHRQDGSIRVWTDVNGTLPGLGLQNQLSNTERARVLIEIAAVFARYSAKRVPTVLLVDWAAKSFDSGWMSRVIDFLSSDENPFQTVLECVTNGLGGHDMARVVAIHGSRSNVTVGPLPNSNPAN